MPFLLLLCVLEARIVTAVTAVVPAVREVTLSRRCVAERRLSALLVDFVTEQRVTGTPQALDVRRAAAGAALRRVLDGATMSEAGRDDSACRIRGRIRSNRLSSRLDGVNRVTVTCSTARRLGRGQGVARRRAGLARRAREAAARRARLYDGYSVSL